MENLLLLAATDSMGTRSAVFAVACIAGVFFIVTGLKNVKTQSAQETGGRRLVNRGMGRSNTYQGSQAVRLGWLRVVCGVGAIIFGIVFIFVGPFLAE